MARLIALVLSLWACAAQAQVWQATTSDDGHFIYHRADAGAGVSFTCLAPSLQGRPAHEVGAHEETPMGPGMTRIEIRSDRASPVVQFKRGDLVLWADQTGYRLPTTYFNDLAGLWEIDLPDSDGLWGALGTAGAVIFAPGADQAWQLPTQNIAQALARVQTDCDQAWRAAQAAPVAPSGQVVTLPSQMAAHVAQGCGAAAVIPGDIVQAGDLDNDGIPDFVMDWGGITCPGPLARPFCGAANCSHNVFLSTRGYLAPRDILGTSVTIIPHPAGGLALGVTGTFSLCGPTGEYCAAPLVWDGTSFVERP